METYSSFTRLILGILCFALIFLQGQAQQCGWQAGGKECANKLCCSSAGYCGTTDPYCGNGCQSNCHQSPPPAPPPPTPPSPITDFFPQEQFEKFLMHRGTSPCTGAFYTYYAFITAANEFPEFGNTGDLETRKREIAAFFGQTSQETYGGWDTAPDGKYTWGYCWVEERGCEGDPSPCTGYCQSSNQWPCANGKAYYGRGPIQLSYNYNYGQAGEALGLDLLNNPELVSEDAVIAFKTAIWFWMTPQSPKPSCHDVIIGQWTPSQADIACNRLPGYGVITNIINGGVECNQGPNDQNEHRIEFYKRYCGIFGISTGDNLDCYTQCPFNWGLLLGGKGKPLSSY